MIFKWDEDEQIRQLVAQHGDENWYLVAQEVPGRSARQCKERWDNYLSPRIVNGPWSKAEDELLLTKIQEMGHQWKALESWFPAHSSVNIKNRWRQIRKERLVSCEQGRKPTPPHLMAFDRVFSALMLESENSSGRDASLHFFAFDGFL
jgi:hypothetical protein